LKPCRDEWAERASDQRDADCLEGLDDLGHRNQCTTPG
jgi:hypothetical protein